MRSLTLLCLILIKSFLSARIRLIVSECAEPNDTSYDQTVSIFAYVKIYRVCFFCFYCRHADQFLLPKLSKSHKSIINHLLRCPQLDTLPTGMTATYCHMSFCQVLIHQCRCKRPHLATRPAFFLAWYLPWSLPWTAIGWTFTKDQRILVDSTGANCTQQCGAATDLGGPPPWKGGSSWLFTQHMKKKLRPHVSESSSQRRRQKLKGRLTKREPSWKAKVSSVVHRRTWSVGIDQKN